jgi:hypothetical protein
LPAATPTSIIAGLSTASAQVADHSTITLTAYTASSSVSTSTEDSSSTSYLHHFSSEPGSTVTALTESTAATDATSTASTLETSALAGKIYFYIPLSHARSPDSVLFKSTCTLDQEYLCTSSHYTGIRQSYWVLVIDLV